MVQLNQSTGSVNESTPFSMLLTDAELLGALERQGLITPTPVQGAAIPAALRGEDLIVQAQTGSGKTLAFMLPILSKVRLLARNSGTAAIIITPTRELAVQICKVVRELCPEVDPACVIGGDSAANQRRSLEGDGRVVVGTPGRLLDLIERKQLVLRTCRQFVLDEADEMLSMGFVEDVRAILGRLPSRRQGMFFSATLSHNVSALAQTFLRSATVIEIQRSVENTPDIRHVFYRVSVGVADKARALCNVLHDINPASAIVFCNTKSDTELVEVFMRRRGFDVQRINSDLSQKERNQVLDGLREGKLRFLIATDVAARGIDINHLELVVNYSIHREAETYVHRVGRTGRAGRSGTAVSLVAPQDSGLFSGLRRTIDVPFEELSLPPELSERDMPLQQTKIARITA